MRKLLLMGCLAALTAFAATAASANDQLEQMAKNPKQWVMPAGNYANTRYSTLKQINTKNVSKLQVAWTFSTGVLRGHEGGPLVVGNVMYVHGPFPNPVFALDLDHDGRILWKYEPRQDPNVIPVMCCDTVNRGLAYADGMMFLHQADTTLVALNAKTGKVVWQVKDGNPKIGETGTSAPLVVKDKVLVGISGGEFGVHCRMTAYDLKTGKRAWIGYSEGPDNQILVDPQKTTALGKPIGKDSSLKTWKGDQWKIGGGCTWGWISYDPKLNLVYYGSGNPSTWNPSQRPGDNKWSMTIWARNPDTGMAKWVYQMTPHDQWDYDGVNEMVLVDKKIDGKMRKLLVHFDRNGFAYTLDRDNGELLVAKKYDPAVNWASGIDMNKSSKDYGRPILVPKYETSKRRREREGHLPGRARHQGRAAFGLLAADRPVLRADQPRLHGLRAVPGRLHRRSALRRRDAGDVSAPGRQATWATSSPGMPSRARSCGRIRSSSRSGPALWRPPAASCSTARSRAI